MTYYESAEGFTIDRARIEKEFRDHGILDCDLKDEFQEFLAFYKLPENQKEFDAQLVLQWLGY